MLDTVLLVAILLLELNGGMALGQFRKMVDEIYDGFKEYNQQDKKRYLDNQTEILKRLEKIEQSIKAR